MLLPEQGVHVRGSPSEWEPALEPPPPAGVPHRGAADAVRSHLLAGKAKTHDCKRNQRGISVV